MKTALILFCSLIGIYAPNSNALNATFAGRACNSCTAEQRETAAIGQGGASGTYKYVYDLTSGQLYKYLVEREPIAGGYTWYASEDIAEPEYKAVVTNLKWIYDNNGHKLTYKSTVGPPGSVANSAWNVVNPGPVRNNTIDYIKNPSNWPLSQSLLFHYQLIVQSAYRMSSGQPITITFEVHFADGSKADFIYTYPENSVAYVDKSGIDSLGNPIPQSRADIVRGPGSTSYDFRSDRADLNTALLRFAEYGIPIERGYYYACTTDPFTGVHCVHGY